MDLQSLAVYICLPLFAVFKDSLIEDLSPVLQQCSRLRLVLVVNVVQISVSGTISAVVNGIVRKRGVLKNVLHCIHSKSIHPSVQPELQCVLKQFYGESGRRGRRRGRRPSHWISEVGLEEENDLGRVGVEGWCREGGARSQTKPGRVLNVFYLSYYTLLADFIIRVYKFFSIIFYRLYILSTTLLYLCYHTSLYYYKVAKHRFIYELGKPTIRKSL